MAALDTSSQAEEEVDENKPSPNDFVAYVPWAYQRIVPLGQVVMSKAVQKDYVNEAFKLASGRRKSRAANVKPPPSGTEVTEERSKSFRSVIQDDDDIEAVQIFTEYSDDRLMLIKMLNNKCVPREIIQIMNLIIQFHIYLRSITINRGIDKTIVYELNKLLSLSRITDLCLDNCFVREGNYHILLEKKNNLSNLSLSRCKINDKVVRNMACLLTYPLPASKTLSLLNLASNQISDEGAKYLAEALRSNRQLNYLNLSGNRLSDTGAEAIFNTMLIFPMTNEESLKARKRYVHYLKELNVLINESMAKLRETDASKKKSPKPTLPGSAKKGKIMERDANVDSTAAEMDAFYQRAKNMAESTLGEFDDPYMKACTFTKDGKLYSRGNNTLVYLNLAYNNLSYNSLKILLSVLEYQKTVFRKPKGLVNMNIEGNPMPASCTEMYKIDNILETGLMTLNRKQSIVIKKKPMTTKSK